VEIIFKDITTIEKGFIAHGVNRRVKMGSGVAKSLYTKWEQVKIQYMSRKNPVPALGSIDEVIINKDLSVFNCYTQEFYGFAGVYANITAIVDSLEKVCNVAKNNLITTIYIPKIGCDRGGLRWEDVEPKLKKLEDKHNIEFVVCRYFDKG